MATAFGNIGRVFDKFARDFFPFSVIDAIFVGDESVWMIGGDDTELLQMNKKRKINGCY